MSKLCLLLPNISHAGIEFRGNIPAIAQKLGYMCIAHHWTQDTFHESMEIDAIQKIIDETHYEKIVIISTSFGDLIARKLLRMGNEKVVAHVSICGLGHIKDLSISSRLLLWLGAHIRKYGYKNAWLIKKIATMFNRPSSPFAVKNAHKINTECAMLGLQKGISQRCLYALKHKETSGKIGVQGHILLSENDNNFSDPIGNAEHIADMYEKSMIVTLGKAGHGSFLEMPEKYDLVVEDMLSRYIGK